MARRVLAGFTLIELLIVIAIVGILAVLAYPTLQEATIRKQVKESMELADLAKKGVAAYYALTGLMPADNDQAGIPPADKIVGNFNTGVAVANGAVTLTYGNGVHKSIAGKRLTIRPALMPTHRMVPLAWVCHDIAAPGGMEIRGENITDIPKQFLPVDCRGVDAK